MSKKSISERIREYYCVEDNKEWLVEKGKVKEGRLLKEACLALEKSNDHYDELWAKWCKLTNQNIIDHGKIIQPYQDKINKLKTKLNTVSGLLTKMHYKSSDLSSLIDKLNLTFEN